jgi:hypothetical protein
MVIGSPRSADSSSGGVKRGNSRIEAPCSRVHTRLADSPTLWDIGSTQPRRSCGSTERICPEEPATNRMFLCVSITPLGRPVEPLV